MIQQKVRFCRAPDGVSIAYAVTGSGPVLVRAPHFLTHLEHDLNLAVRRHWIEALSRDFTVVRFDPRGCGLSDRDPPDLSLGRWVGDLEAVVDSAGLDRFTLFGPSQGGPVAIEYAVRHAARVSHLVLFGAFARGKRARRSPREAEDALAQLKLVELGWGSDDPAYRQVFASQLMPGASPDEQASLTEMMRVSATASDAVRLMQMVQDIDVVETARQVSCPTLVIHARGDRRIPYEEGRLLATLIPGARFVTLESINHMLPPDDPAWAVFLEELRGFVPAAAVRALGELTAREGEVLDLLARGHDNDGIAVKLGITEKTVRNHLTRIYEKLMVRRRGEAIVLAREAGLGLAQTHPP
jgi:pimeloyl-ACP methyl ester carboxylesterase